MYSISYYGKQNSNDMGNRKNVLDRWYGAGHRSSDSEARKPRAPFRGTPQFDFEQLYIAPFTHRRSADEQGNIVYRPVEERNLAPTGVAVMDDWLRHLADGRTDLAAFCARYNARTSDLDSLVFLLTGMSNFEFRTRWQLRTADALLRYTKMSVEDIARRCGMGTRGNMYFIYEREFNLSPTERRRQLREKGDLGRFAIK